VLIFVPILCLFCAFFGLKIIIFSEILCLLCARVCAKFVPILCFFHQWKRTDVLGTYPQAKHPSSSACGCVSSSSGASESHNNNKNNKQATINIQYLATILFLLPEDYNNNVT
jgi:hypothetical protein